MFTQTDLRITIFFGSVLPGSQPRRVVGVGSVAGQQIRDQRGGSMADETIVRIFGGN